MNYKVILLFISMLYGYANCYADGIRIAWDYSSMQQIAEMGGYPRLLRMQDNSLIIIYEDRKGDIQYKRTYNEGKTWSDPVEVFSKFSYSNLSGESTVVNIANPEIIQLKNGDILIACNYRPAKAEIAPYSIVIRRSKDNGRTWLPPQTLYTAAPRFIDGCWEPSFLQLPYGELQVYFANENPYQQSDEQEISMISSKDNGETWTKEHTTISFRKNRRDGMPVARIIGDEIVVVIEDNNIDRFKPYTVRTKVADNWSQPVLTDSPCREYALKEQIDTAYYLGAPYLLVLPTGETVISYQTNENRDKDWELSTMEVAVGDKTARNFNRRTRPFEVPLDKEAKWNSIALWDENTIVAVASSNFNSKHVAPWIIKGYIIPDLKITDEKINSYPIFIGSEGETNLRAGLSADKDNIWIECKIKDSSLFSGNTASDGIYIYLDTGKNIYRLWSSYDGKPEIQQKKGTEWKPTNPTGIHVIPYINKEGYNLLLNIPKKSISLQKNKPLRLNIGLSAYEDETTGYTELLINSDPELPHTWLRIDF